MKLRIQKEIIRRAAGRRHYEDSCHCVAQGTVDKSLAPKDDKQAIEFYEERCRCHHSKVEREGTLAEAHAHREERIGLATGDKFITRRFNAESAVMPHTAERAT